MCVHKFVRSRLRWSPAVLPAHTLQKLQSNNRLTQQGIALVTRILGVEDSEVLRLCPPWNWYEPSSAQYLTGQDPNANYNLQDANVNSTFVIPPVIAELLVQQFADWQGSAEGSFLPRTMPTHLVHTSFVPWSKLVADSYFQLGIWQYDCRVLEDALYKAVGDLTYENWQWYFAEWLRGSNMRMAIFVGTAPYTNAALKCVANLGSQFFDTVIAVIAGMYQLGTLAASSKEAAPNDILKQLYEDLILSQGVGPGSLCTRHWNNKGNSMEALMLVAYEDAQFALLWFTAYICIYKTQVWWLR